MIFLLCNIYEAKLKKNFLIVLHKNKIICPIVLQLL